MKKIILLTLMFLSFSSIKAQDNELRDKAVDQENYNEVKLNALLFIIGAFDLTYERTLNEESALGVSVFIPYDEEVKETINYYISPYYRLYFGEKYASGFYLEGFGMLNSYVEEIYNSQTFSFEEGDNITDFALGIGLGGKWITNRGLLGEIGAGIGRNLFSDESEDFVGKLAITLGYRF